jgi:hypothetical protein
MIKLIRTYILLLVFLFFTAVSCIAQDSTSNPLYFSLKPQYGFIIPHSPSIRSISDFNPYGFEAETGWHLKGQKDWERCNCYSRAGFSLLHINYNAPDVLGSSTNLIAFAEPFFNYKGFVLTSIRMGVGASYISKVYDAETNPQNLYFSSPLSFLVHIDVNLTKFITEQWFLKAYFKYNHISNGGIEKPNKGMNFPTYGLGVGYSFSPVNFKTREKRDMEKPIPVKPSVQAFGTLRGGESDKEISERSPAIGVIVKARRLITRINALNAGFEGTADYYVKEKMKQDENSKDYRQLSFLVGHDFIFGKFIFSQYWGTYLYAPYYENKNFYQRYSLTYQLFENVNMGVTLKAHAEVAENFNFLLEYEF